MSAPAGQCSSLPIIQPGRTILAREINLAGELEGPIFEPLNDPACFRLFTLNPSIHTIAWPNGADLAPDLRQQVRRAA